MSDSAGTIRDFLIKLGFDASEVTKGLQDVEKRLAKTTAKEKDLKNKAGLEQQQSEVSRYKNTLKKMQDMNQQYTTRKYKGVEIYSQKNVVANQKASIAEEKRLQNWFKTRETEDQKFAKSETAKRLDATRRREKAEAESIAKRTKLERDAINKTAALDTQKENLKNKVRLSAKSQIFKASGVYGKDQVLGVQKNISDKYNGLVDKIAAAKDVQEINRLKHAFAELNAEINRTRTSQTRMNNQFSITKGVGGRLGGLAPSAFGGGMIGGMMGGVASTAMRNPFTAVIASAGILATVMSRVASKMEAVRLTLTAAAGDAVQAGKDFAYVKDIAMKYGVSLEDAARGYAKIGVAARNAGLSVDQTRELFLAGTEASVAFGLSSEEVGGIFKAFSDMLSKGTVTAEEMKNQLGDRLPIAIAAGAKAMSVTPKEFLKLMEQGKIAANEFLPKFATGLRDSANEGDAVNKALNTSSREIGRIGAAWEIAMSDMAQAGGEEGLVDLLKSIKTFITDNKVLFQAIGKILGGVYSFIARIIDIVGILLDVLTLPLKMLINAFTTDRIDEFGNKVKSLAGWAKPFARIWDIIIGSIKIAIGMTQRFLNLLESVGSDYGMDERKASGIKKGIDERLYQSNPFSTAISGLLGLDTTPQNNRVNSTAAAAGAYDNVSPTGSKPVVKQITVDSKPTININGGNPQEIKSQIDSMFQNEYIAGMYYGGGA